ncbi:hypothetical protein HRbin21_01552 [bacterium HR21]|nr:hypothetical protein HRbin21_01552 [bacterium HR21]
MERLKTVLRVSVALLLLGCSQAPLEPEPSAGVLEFPGMCYTAFRADAFRIGQRLGALRELRQQTAAGWVALCVFEYQSTPTSADIAPNTDGRNPVTGQPNPTTSTPEDIRAAVADARALGLRLLLKPHVDVYSGAWRGTIQPSPEWFRAYTAMMVRYAQLAEELGIEMLCIGTELVTATQTAWTPFWERLIDTIRQVYRGRLLYAANWEGTPEVPGAEFSRIGFWQRLDFIGVNFYPPATASPQEPVPTPEEIVQRWDGYRRQLRALARQLGKRVVITEVGCQSVQGALAAPWDYRRGTAPGALPDMEAQERYYQAVRLLCAAEPWCAGVFWWEWESVPSPSEQTGYTPRNKPAARVVREWYQQASARAEPGRGWWAIHRWSAAALR